MAGRWVHRLALLAVCTLFAAGYSSAQVDSAAIGRDTTGAAPRLAPRIAGDTVRAADTTGGGFHMRKNSLLAVGLSAVLPGAGQFYNEDYWKVPVIAGLGGYWVYAWVHQNNRYKDFREQYEKSLVELPPAGDERLRRLRDFYRDDRDKFAWYLGVLYLANLIDAYIGAHLYDFDVGPDLTYDGRVVPKVMATVRLKL